MKSAIILSAIVILGFFLRTLNINWDQSFHLHPDERFLTMVGNALSLPQSFSEYINPQQSPFNPINKGFPFFVYGVFPVILNKIIALLLGNDTYNAFTIQGKILSAVFDSLIILFIYKTSKSLESYYKISPAIKYLASFLYAIAVLPIQLSHFFAVDTFLNFFMFASFYFSLLFYFKRRTRFIVFSALSLGLAFASKITAFFIVPLLLYFLVKGSWKKGVKKTIQYALIFLITLYATIRLANPYYFESSNILNPAPSKQFVASIQMLKSYENKEVWYPPSVQWIDKPPIIFSFYNLALFGLGPGLFISFLLGFFILLKDFRKSLFTAISILLIAFFFYQSTQFAKTMRYFIFLYPFFALYAGVGLAYRNRISKIILWILLLLCPLFFISIYLKDHTRVEASKWIYANIPTNSVLLHEHWDDPIPLQIKDANTQLFIETLPVFDLDTKDKWVTMDTLLEKGDYLILSSNRGWGSIPTVPEKYPRMSKFYADLFEGKLPYKKIKEFTSYPSLRYVGIPLDIPDDFAEESFTVYDHPRVIIFQKEKPT